MLLKKADQVNVCQSRFFAWKFFFCNHSTSSWPICVNASIILMNVNFRLTVFILHNLKCLRLKTSTPTVPNFVLANEETPMIASIFAPNYITSTFSFMLS